MTEKATKIRKQLATVLESWMRARPDLDTQVKLAKASGLGQTTIGRILNCTVSATVDSLDSISAAFGKQPGELLLSESDNRVKYDAKRYARLPDYEKIRVEAFIEHVLSDYENSPKPKTDTKKKAGRVSA
jgi:transcriptional regulator with XRE-family HTH domain